MLHERILTILVLSGLGACATADTTASLRVALYADPVATDAKSRDAVERVLSATEGIRVDKVSSSTVMADSFASDYDVVILPGGTGGGQASSLGVKGGQKLTELTRQGKGLIAICAGGYYAGVGWNEKTGALDVVNAVNHDGENWARGEGFITVKPLQEQNTATSRTMWFENGPIFVPAESATLPHYTPLVKYETDMAAPGAPKGMMQGRDAVIASEFGKGRVVAFGPHPELSPELNHWLVNAVKWSCRNSDNDNGRISFETVLEPQLAPSK